MLFFPQQSTPMKNVKGTNFPSCIRKNNKERSLSNLESLQSQLTDIEEQLRSVQREREQYTLSLQRQRDEAQSRVEFRAMQILESHQQLERGQHEAADERRRIVDQINTVEEAIRRIEEQLSKHDKDSI